VSEGTDIVNGSEFCIFDAFKKEGFVCVDPLANGSCGLEFVVFKAHEIIEKIAAQWINIRRDKLGGSLFLW
jgi:hypothetical protein